jgi:hypothetical protein
MMSETDRAYLAGLIDGEGCINLSISSNGMVVAQISVSNHAPQMHIWLRERFGGTDGKIKGKRTETRWNTKETMIPVLESCLPYLVAKKKDALIVLQFVKAMGEGQGNRHSLPMEERLQLMALLHLVREERAAELINKEATCQ